MDEVKFFSAHDVLTLLDAHTSMTYQLGGSIRVEKAGIKGTGKTPADAAADWGRQFAEMVILPRENPVDREVGKCDEDQGDTV